MLNFSGWRRLPISISKRVPGRYTARTAQANFAMDSFLKDARGWLRTAPNKVSIVIGNESCDLDSMTSAILFAWFRNDSNLNMPTSRRYVPLLNIPKEDIKLRPEFKTLLETCHINIDNLITLTDLPEPSVLPPEHTQWILVDHNKLNSKLGSIYANRVQGCIDHHEEENSVPRDVKSEPRIVETAGSCISLVLRELAPQVLDLEKDLEKEPRFDSDVLKLGLASILIDTNNLQDHNKTKKVDTDIASHLDRILQSRSMDWNRNTFFEMIAAAKKNLDGLSFSDVLRKDYKQWREEDINLGISSVVRNLDFVDSLVKGSNNDKANDEQYVVKASKFMAERELDLWAVMTAFVEDSGESQGFQRELRIHWRNTRNKKVVTDFEQEHGDGSQLKLIANGKQSPNADLGWNSWYQHEVAASRKQVAPMLRNAIKQYRRE